MLVNCNVSIWLVFKEGQNVLSFSLQGYIQISSLLLCAIIFIFYVYSAFCAKIMKRKREQKQALA